MTRTDIFGMLEKALPQLTRDYGVKRIGVFGSFAKGQQTDESDVDIVVEFDRSIGFRFVEFSETLERTLGRKVDVLTPAGVSGIRNQDIARSIEDSILYVQPH